MRRTLDGLGIAMLAWYGAAIAIATGLILFSAPHFSYVLDDPYIHIALAQNIAHFHYGINAGETVSPSSSVLWPFLLAPFSRIPVLNEWVPLILNVLFTIGTCVVTGRFLGPRMRRAGFGTASIAVFAAGLILCANFMGLALMGMEHSLQLLIVAMAAISILTAYEGGAISTPFLVAAALGPSVRYEDVVFTGAVCAVLWLQRRRGTAVVVFLASLLPLAALGLFLHLHGLPAFPNSVLAKGVGTADSASHAAPLMHLWEQAKINLGLLVTKPTRWPLTLSLLVVVIVAWWNRSRRPLMILLVAAAASIVMLLVGPWGWFYRYDMAIRYFLIVLAVGLLLLPEALPFPVLRKTALGIAFSGGVVMLFATARMPFAGIEIARQQYQMHRLAHDFVQENIAVNDLGWVSMDSYRHFYVLDLFGLANNEALTAPVKDEAWMQEINDRHHTSMVMIYSSWFKEIPPGWSLLGVLRQRPMRLEGPAAEKAVMIYATSASKAAELRPRIEAFRRTLPDGVQLDSE